MSHSAALRDALSAVPLFSACSKRDLQIVARHMQVIAIPAGTVFIREGEVGDAFYVALEGTASVSRSLRTVAAIEPGDHVGELALLDAAPRTASVAATSAMVLGVLDARTFHAIVRDVPALTFKLLRALAIRLRARDAEAAPP